MLIDFTGSFALMNGFCCRIFVLFVAVKKWKTFLLRFYHIVWTEFLFHWTKQQKRNRNQKTLLANKTTILLHRFSWLSENSQLCKICQTFLSVNYSDCSVALFTLSVYDYSDMCQRTFDGLKSLKKNKSKSSEQSLNT